MTVQKNNKWVQRLAEELNEMANACFATPEFQLLYGTSLTKARARFYTSQMYFFNLNRRDCWGYVQARGPFEVKQAIWHHEQDELFRDPRGGADHRELIIKEARAVGITEDLEQIEITPHVQAALFGWLHIASTYPWLGALTASHMLERQNDDQIIDGGGTSRRWKNKLVDELDFKAEVLISSNVHIEAETEHSDLIWGAISQYLTDDQSYRVALQGATDCVKIHRAFRGALGLGMAALSEDD